MPLTEQKVQIFLTTLKALVPNVEIKMSMMYEPAVNKDDAGVCLEEQAAINPDKKTINHCRCVCMNLLKCLKNQAGFLEKHHSASINEEYTRSSSKINTKIQEVLPITPLEISDCQSDVIQAIQNNPLVTVFGPPGTGKSQT